jgi:16S rRNA (cytosine967-C5)-methyltransferase
VDPSEAKIKFVNAILRRIASEGKQLLLDDTSATDNVAPWLYHEWERAWGEDRARQICLQFMTEAPVYLSVNTASEVTQDGRIKRYEHVRQLFGDDTAILPHGSIRVGESVKGPVSEWPLYTEGMWWVQDASAAIPALALFNAIHTQAANTLADISTMHVVDLCAAPGGKTAQLLSFGFGKVTAVEMNVRRSKRLGENLSRLGLMDRCEVVIRDGSVWKPNQDDVHVSGVLVDVPCSATGTASRRPDVLQRSEDLGNLLQTQHELAVNAVNNIIGVGGIMVYATCSLLMQESEEQVQKLLNMENGTVLETVPFVAGEIPGFDDAIDEHGWMRVIPGSLAFRCDGFFVARLRKVR